MFLEIEKIKKEKLEHYENNPDLFIDAICRHKLLIDQKNLLAYTDDQFVRDIFKELNSDHLPASFHLEFECADIKWLINCKNYTSAGLIRKASLYYLNLKFSGTWKMEINTHQQIIALTTQLSDMKSEILKLANASKGGGNGGGTSGGTLLVKTSDESQQKKGNFPLWRLEKIPSSAEHNMVKRKGQKWYWCKDGHSFQNKCAECIAGTNLVLGMLLGLLVRRSTSRIRLQRRVILPPLHLLHCLHPVLLSNLTLVIHLSFCF
jgi:hypothetical protein